MTVEGAVGGDLVLEVEGEELEDLVWAVGAERLKLSLKLWRCLCWMEYWKTVATNELDVVLSCSNSAQLTSGFFRPG